MLDPGRAEFVKHLLLRHLRLLSPVGEPTVPLFGNQTSCRVLVGMSNTVVIWGNLRVRTSLDASFGEHVLQNHCTV